jgi:hypothetical protein
VAGNARFRGRVREVAYAVLYVGVFAMAKPVAGAPPDKLTLYEKLVATNPKVERKGATVPYTSLNGHMFSYLSKEGKLALRLPPVEREAFLKKYKARLCEAYGVVQPEYVEVPDSLLSSTQELKKFFDCSYEYVSSLKPSRKKGGR